MKISGRKHPEIKKPEEKGRIFFKKKAATF